MGKVIDMSRFQHQRDARKAGVGSQPGAPGWRYTCAKTGVTFPPIYRVLIPDGDMEHETAEPYFTGSYSTYFQLKQEPFYGNSTLPGFPPSQVGEMNCLEAGAAYFLEVIHFADKAFGRAFMDGCLHMGLPFEKLDYLESESGIFLLLTRTDHPKLHGLILYRTSAEEFIPLLQRKDRCEYVAAFNSVGELVPSPELEEDDEE